METKKLTAKDLMIGDWVLCLESTHKNKVFAQIDAIEEGQRSILLRKGNTNWFLYIDFIEPIPLTAEILEKNGFSELMEHDEWSRIFRVYHDDLFIEVGIYEPMFINIGYVDNEGEEQPLSDIVKVHGENFYVHELQHTLRLCGINDKEIVL